MPSIFLDRAFAHANTQLEQLTSDALSSPESIVACHLLDQCNRFWREPRLSGISLRLVFPEQAEKFPMPAKHGLRLHYEERLLPGPHHPRQKRQEEPICLLAGRSFDLPMQDDELLP